MDRNTHWTAVAALLVSSIALGASAWSVGCHRGETSALGEPLTEPTPPASALVVPAATAHVATPVPAASSAATTPRTEPARDERIAADATAPMRVKRLVVARGVDKREPVQPGSSFDLTNEPLYAFVELANPASQDAGIVITFEKGAKDAGHIELNVPAGMKRWRTWGRTSGVREQGQWHVVVRSSEGKELARESFEVVTRSVQESASAG